MKYLLITCLIAYATTLSMAQGNVKLTRARDLGIPFDGIPGSFNAITDVPGIEVGYTTLISGEGELKVGKGPVRTGVTVILPKGKTAGFYPAAWFSLNGDGEMTGLPYLEDYGMGYGPVGITNTNSVGAVRDAIGAWCFRQFSTGDFFDFSFGLPIVGETWDGGLNDINGYHVKPEHVWEALDKAAAGPVAEGNVGGGAGMWLYGFKGGSGTSSRVFNIDSTTSYTLGVFVQANFGVRQELTIAGVPMGKEITELAPIQNTGRKKDGSIIVVIATDAPLLPGQLKQVAKRATHGIARTGSISHNGSGDIFLALSTASPEYAPDSPLETWRVLPKWQLDAVYKATVEATEEAIINAMIAARDLDGINNNKFFAIPHDKIRELLRKYNRTTE